MPTSEGSSPAPVQRVGSRLPPAAVAAIREAFAEEVAERLPRLRTAARTLDPTLLPGALRDVHTLGSSAYVVGADAAARSARAAEAALVEQRPLQQFVALVAVLDEQLRGWRP